jgi:hypothetical protein
MTTRDGAYALIVINFKAQLKLSGYSVLIVNFLVLKHSRTRGGVWGGVVLIFDMISKKIKLYNSLINNYSKRFGQLCEVFTGQMKKWFEKKSCNV